MNFHKRILLIILILIISAVTISAKEYFTYTIKNGDSLSEIASNFDININELIKLNGIKNANRIYVGQKLRIPSEEVEYTIKEGDTLKGIALTFKISLAKLIEVNHLKNPDVIFIGQKLIIPVVKEEEKEYQVAARSQRVNYIWPTQGRLTSNYGWRNHPIRRGREFHTGIDIAVPIGSPVYASADGVVIFSGWSRGYGNLIVIKHRDGRQSFYGHNIELMVRRGDIIRQGKIIALSGSSGVSTGPHLHFEIRLNGKTYDPLRVLNQKYWRNNFRV